MLPQRPSGPNAVSPPGRKSGIVALPVPSFEQAKRRVLAKLEDRLDMSASKRMPQSLLRQSLRSQADVICDQEARGLSKPERDKIVDEVLAELLGYGPLEELFADAAVREIMVTGPGTVIARRDMGQWLPTSVKFRDEEHVRAVLDKIATHADAVGPVMASMVVFDMKLPNGFRAVALIPPDALGQPATASFLREATIPVPKEAPKAGAVAPGGSVSAGTRPNAVAPGGSVSAGTLPPLPVAVTSSPRAPGDVLNTPAPRAGAVEGHDPLARYRGRILERLLSKFASIGLYDVSRLDVNELRKVIGAYVAEYVASEKIYLSDTDQGRLTLEILTSLRK